MNADFVPGIITILHGQRMEAMGARTVGEAISMTPGVESAINNPGDPKIIIRGIGNGHHSGHMQVQLNSVTVNKTFDGATTSAFMIPIEQVERIEIIRGPGASLHGEFAYSGVINIITKQSNRAYASGGAFGTFGGGLSYRYENPETGFHFQVNGSSWRTEGSGIDSGKDHFASRPETEGRSNSPGPIDDEDGQTLGVVKLGVGGLEARIQTSERRYGHYYGMLALTQEGLEGWQEEKLNAVRVSYHTSPGETYDVKVYADAAENSFEVKNHLLAPQGAPIPLEGGEGPPPPGGRPNGPSADGIPPGAPEGRLISNYYGESKSGAGLEAAYKGWRHQKWLFQAQYSKVAMGDVWQEYNFDPATGEALDTPRRYSGPKNNWLTPGKERTVVGLALQDQVAVSENLNLILGVRSDDFDDAGSSVSPRLAGVWRSGPHIVKAQYAHAYRPPTFAELYSPTYGVGRLGNPDLKAETSRTAELGYIFNQPGVTARVTVYQSNLESMIAPGDLREGRNYANKDKARQQGVEMEMEMELGEEWTLAANASYCDLKDVNTNQDVGNYAKVLGNIKLFGAVADNLLLAIRAQYVGDRERLILDPREDRLPAYTLVNISVNWHNAGMHGLSLRAGVNNIADHKYKSISATNSYPEDLPRTGRAWWAQVSYDF
ncbi:MAG: TonB-dependent receptor [Nitrospinota bacterium]|nr:TonB-dependent receptor [Nitrospinota bacterium]